MKLHRFGIGLTAINLLLLVLLLTGAGAGVTRERAVAPVLRGRELELVDARGQVRSRLSVAPDGEVVLRLFDRQGTIRVKLGASEHGSGLLLTDEATDPAVHIVARRRATAERPATTSITLRGGSGEPRVITP